ncbi:MAG: sigma 54-interacting transcriptional regulator, partial [Anaerolineales bacterium]|nr:sigma 54-interacting transcriptional regulator [Anaerolineales bacterium]
MGFFSIAYVSFIAIALTLLIIHFRVWLSRRGDLDNLMFSLAALGAAGLAVMELLYYKTESLEEFNLLMKLMHIPLFILLVSITWFVWFYFKTGRRWMAISITALWTLGLIFNFIVGDNLTFIEVEGLKQVQTFTGEIIYMPFGRVNPLAHLTNLASLLFVIYVIDATVRLVRKGNKRRAYLVGFSMVFFILVAGIQAPLIDFGILESASMISLPFTAILFAMSIQLSGDIIHTFSLSKEVIAKEARWSKLLNEVKLLVVGIDSIGKVNYANPYFLKITGFVKEEIIGKEWIKGFIPEHFKKQLKESFPLPLKGDIPKHFQNCILTQAGIELMIFWSNVTITNENGEVQEIIAVGTDVTEREEAFDKVLELKQQLEVENLALKESFDDGFSVSSIVIKSDASKYAFQMAKEVAKVDTTVLLQGETGVGKGVYARFIHEQSKREGGTFLQVNCAAIPSDLLESELFGYERGAFTGAVKQKKGRFELADEGTLFLDEIGELPGALQAKLLRVLQSGEFERLGSEKTQKVDVRIIAATNRILSEEVQKGNFREDLYYRINVFPITIPPLRKRKEDIPELIEYFTFLFHKKYEKKITGISKQSYVVANKYNWPGNIRELQNVIERAVISSHGDTLRIDVLEGSSVIMKADQELKESGPIKLDDVERAHILKILDQCSWRIHGDNGAAELLDI